MMCEAEAGRLAHTCHRSTWEAEADGCYEYDDILDYRVRHCFILIKSNHRNKPNKMNPAINILTSLSHFLSNLKILPKLLSVTPQCWQFVCLK